MDELKIKTSVMRELVGRAITRYLKKKGIDVDVMINDIDGCTSDRDGDLKIRADLVLVMSKAQVVKILS